MKNVAFLLFTCIAFGFNAGAVTADFTAEEAMNEYYSQGFDSEADVADWSFGVTASGNTWHLAERPYVNGLPAFSAIDSGSKMSLAIKYDDYVSQNETVTSPAVSILPDSRCEFYACFSGGLLSFARWTFEVTDVDSSETKVLVDAFQWMQSRPGGFDGPNWQKFTVDLAEYVGKKLKFTFRYRGIGGEDVLIDGFKVMQSDNTGSKQVVVDTGSAVHFSDLSSDDVATWKWEFEGGTPSVSTEQNPVVTYAAAGEYSVKLTVSDGQSSSEKTREAFVKVNAVAPTAEIGLPEEGYLSPFAACFVPLNVPLQFCDLSKGSPESWEWQFPGSDKEKTSEQNPVVTYLKAGLHSLSLRVRNAIGIDDDILTYAVQAGGSQYIWNIGVEENSELNPVGLGWYGYYGGSNMLGMVKFAEKFAAPIIGGTIKSVDIYFASVATVSPDAEITVSVCSMGEDGMPADVLAVSKPIKAGDLNPDTNFKPTVFEFAEEVKVDSEFFIVVNGIPNSFSGDKVDEIAMYCSPLRGEGGKCTAYHQLENQDDNGRPTGGYTWYENTEDPLSLAIAPLFTFSGNASVAKVEDEVHGLACDGRDVILTGDYSLVEVYGIGGNRMLSVKNPSVRISLDGIPSGVYIARAVGTSGVETLKVVKR